MAHRHSSPLPQKKNPHTKKNMQMLLKTFGVVRLIIVSATCIQCTWFLYMQRTECEVLTSEKKKKI